MYRWPEHDLNQSCASSTLGVLLHTSMRLSVSPDPNPTTSPQLLDKVLHWSSRLPLALLQSFGRLLAGLLLWLPDKGLARTVYRNLKLCFPAWSEQQLRQVTRQAVRHQILAFLEFLRCWGNPPSDSLQRIHTVHNLALLEQALADPKGCLAIVPHHGSWEIMNAWLNQRAAPVIMYKPDDNPSLNRFVLQARSRLNATLVPTDDSGVRQIFRTLKTGGFSILLPDHLPDRSGGIESAFFGWPVLTSTLASKLAQKTQCAVVMLSCLRRDDDPQRFDIVVDPIDPAIYQRDLQQSVDALNHSIEQLIRRNPAHYHWSYKRFKLVDHLQGYYHVDTAEQAEQIRLAGLQATARTTNATTPVSAATDQPE
jgi:KDO2-lipid IV(A) lauroyltransferase